MTDVAFDTETTGLSWQTGEAEPFMVQVRDSADGPDHIALLGPALEEGMPRVGPYIEADRAYDMLRKAGRNTGHNAPFDIHQMRADGLDLLAPGAPPVVNTKTLAQIVAPERRIAEDVDDRRGYRLKELAATYVDPHAQDAEAELERLAQKHGFRLKAKPGQQGYVEAAYFKLWQLEPEAFEQYARDDTRLTRGLLHALEAELTDANANGGHGTRNIWELEQQLGPWIWRAEARGIAVDADAADHLRSEYVEEAQRLRDQLDAELPAGWDDNNEALAASLQGVGVPLDERTPSGQIATNKYALERQVSHHPILQTLLDYRTAEKFVSTYLDHFVGRDVIHPTFNEIGAWTGRMSGQQPNMQNVPVRSGTAVRELFVPREDCAFVSFDFEQIELRLLGHMLNDLKLIERIENEDFFAWVASQVPQFAREYGMDPAAYMKGGPAAHLRTIAKNGTYAIVYGVGGLKLGKMFGWPPDSTYGPRDYVVRKGWKKVGEPRCLQAEAFIKSIKSILTGYSHLVYDRITPQVQQIGGVNTILGRWQWLGHDGGWKGLSALIQGGAGDIFKKAVVAACEAAAPWDYHPLLFIHDELLMEGPVGAAEAVSPVIQAAMEGVMPGFRPRLAAEGHIAYNNWGEAK